MGTDARIFDSTSRTCLYFDRLFNLDPERYAALREDSDLELASRIFEKMRQGESVSPADVTALVIGNQTAAPSDRNGDYRRFWNKCVELFVAARPDGRFFIRDEHQYEWLSAHVPKPDLILPWPDERPGEMYIEVGSEFEAAAHDATRFR